MEASAIPLKDVAQLSLFGSDKPSVIGQLASAKAAEKQFLRLKRHMSRNDNIQEVTSEKEDFYDVFEYGDRLEPGVELKIEHSITMEYDTPDLTPFTNSDVKELESLRKISAERSKKSLTA